MEIIQYVKWTQPKEEQRFLNLAKQFKNDSEFIDIAVKEFETDRLTIRVAMLRLKDKISKVRNK